MGEAPFPVYVYTALFAPVKMGEGNRAQYDGWNARYNKIRTRRRWPIGQLF